MFVGAAYYLAEERIVSISEVSLILNARHTQCEAERENKVPMLLPVCM